MAGGTEAPGPSPPEHRDHDGRDPRAAPSEQRKDAAEQLNRAEEKACDRRWEGYRARSMPASRRMTSRTTTRAESALTSRAGTISVKAAPAIEHREQTPASRSPASSSVRPPGDSPLTA